MVVTSCSRYHGLYDSASEIVPSCSDASLILRSVTRPLFFATGAMKGGSLVSIPVVRVMFFAVADGKIVPLVAFIQIVYTIINYMASSVEM